MSPPAGQAASEAAKRRATRSEAYREARDVELSGTGRSLPDGHYHETRWSEAQVDTAVEVFEDGCSARGRRPALGAVVQHVELTDDAEHAGRRWLDRAARVVPAPLLPTVEELLDCPYVLIGSPQDLASKLAQLRDRWGFTRFTVRSIEPLVEVFAAIGRTATR